jgi:transcription elongation factor S-II
METIEAARKTIQNYLNNTEEDENEVIGAIDELSYVEIDIELIKSTGIGRIITKLSKDKRSDTIASHAKKLEKKWKTIVVNSPTPPPKAEKRNRSISTDQQSSGKRKNVKEEPEKKETTVDNGKTPSGVNNFKGETNNAARNTVQVKLCQALGQCSVVGGMDSSRVAVTIETTMFKHFGDAKNKDYQAKFRSLFSNLKDPLNEGLRSALFTGDLSADTLINMSHEELANPTLQQERKKLKEYQQEARRGDRHMRDATCSMFTCNKCGQNKTTYFQLQTRSADEPMTTFVTCCNCGHHWKF